MFNVLGQNQFLGLFWWPGLHGWNETIMNGLSTSVCWTRTGDYNIKFISGPDAIRAVIFRAAVDFFMLQLGSERNLSKPQAQFWQVTLKAHKNNGKACSTSYLHICDTVELSLRTRLSLGDQILTSFIVALNFYYHYLLFFNKLKNYFLNFKIYLIIMLK